MKIKLSARLLAVSGAVIVSAYDAHSVVYGTPLDVNYETEITETVVSGILVGAKAMVSSDITSSGDVVIGVGKRIVGEASILPSEGELMVRGCVLTVKGSLYAGDSGMTAYPEYVLTSVGQDGKLNISNGAEVNISHNLYMGYAEGSYDAEVVANGALNVGGSIYVGYFCSDDEISKGAMNGDPQSRLLLGNGASVTAKEIVVGNGGALSVQSGSSLNISGELYVPSDEKDASIVFAEGSVVSAQSIQIGSLYGSSQSGTVSAQIDGMLNLTGTEESLCIASGKVTIGRKAVIMTRGNVQIGSGMVENVVSGLASDVSFTLNGELNITNGASLYVMDDVGMMIVNGRATVANAELASSVTIGEGGLLSISGTTTIRDHVVITNKNAFSACGEETLSMGAVSIRDGSLTLARGEAYAKNVTIRTQSETALQIEKEAALYVAGKMQTENNGQSVVVNGTLSVSGPSELGKVVLGNTGIFEINGAVIIDRLELFGNEDGEVGLILNNKLTAYHTYIGSDIHLANTVTSSGGGSLGEILIGSGNKLGLSGYVTVDAVTTSDAGSAIIVSGKENNLGAVLIYGEDRASIAGAGTHARDYWNEGYTELSGSLTVYDEESGTGSYINNGTTVLAINKETATLARGESMLTAGNLQGEGKLSVKIDLTDKAVQSLVGKQINFITENGLSKQLCQEQIENIISGSARKASFVRTIGDESAEGRADKYILIDYTDRDGQTKAFGYHYYSDAATSADLSDGYSATGVEFDRFYSRVHAREAGQGDILAAERVYESEWSGESIVTKVEEDDAELITLATHITASDNSDGNAATPAMSVLTFLERRQCEDETPKLTSLGGAEQYNLIFREDAGYTGAEDGSGVLGIVSGEEGEVQFVDGITLVDGVKISLDRLAMGAEQSLSMGEGSELTIKDATVTIGGGKTTDFTDLKDTAGNLIGDLRVKTASGETQTLSELYNSTRSEINGATIRIVAENRDASLIFNTVTDANNIPVICETTMNDTSIYLNQTSGTATMGGLGDNASQIVLRGNSSVSGTGTLNNVTFENTTLYYTMNSTMDGVNEHITFGSGITGSVRLAWAIGNENMPDADYYDETAVGKTISLDRYSEVGLQVDATPMTNELNQTALSYGYMWTYSQDALILGYDRQADAQRIANTMISSSATVVRFGRNSRAQANGRRGKGTRVWATGDGENMKQDTAKAHRGFAYKTCGYSIGCDTEIGQRETVLGISVGQTFGENTPNDGNGYYTAGKIEQDTLMCGVYGTRSYRAKDEDKIVLDMYAAYGKTSCDSHRSSLASGKATDAKWDENAMGIGVTVSYVRAVKNNTYITPYIGLEYTNCTIDSFVEHGHSDVQYSGSSYSNVELTLGISISKAYTLSNGEILMPYIRLSYLGDIVRNEAKVTAESRGKTKETETSVPIARNAIGIQTGTNWQITPQWGANIGYMAEIRSGTSDQTFNVGVNYTF